MRALIAAAALGIIAGSCAAITRVERRDAGAFAFDDHPSSTEQAG